MFIKAIPSLLTIGNLFIGMAAVLVASHGRLNEAALLVVLGMLLDGLDGRAARWLNAESEFGKQLDSLADMVTFGVAPSFIMYAVVLNQLGYLGDALALWFPICGALRLARFNLQKKSHPYFIGLPITAAGGVLATMALAAPVLQPSDVILPCGMFLLSLLMISSVRYPNFKRLAIPRSAFIAVPVFCLAVFILIKYQFVQVDWMIFSILAFYAAYGSVRSVQNFRRRRRRYQALREKKISSSDQRNTSEDDVHFR